MLSYRDLPADTQRTFLACYGGFAFDAMDVMLFSFIVPTLLTVWSMSKGQAGTIVAVTLFASAVGGTVAGALADRIGRVKILQISILCYAICTFLCAFTSTPGQIMTIRMFQGLGFGGEWTVGSVLIGEVIDARFRGQIVGFVQSSWAIGWAMAAIISTTLLSSMSAEYAWRAVFLIGLLPAMLVYFIRRSVRESPIYLEARKKGATKEHQRRVTLGSHASIIFRGSLLAIGIQGGYYAIASWLPTFLRLQRHLSIIGSGSYLGLIILGSLIGYIFSALLTDRIGRRLNFIFFAIGSCIITILYTYLPITNREMLYLSIPLGLFSTGIFGALGSFYTELFPTQIRATAQGFCYNFGRGLAAFFPMLIGISTKFMPLGDAIAVMASIAYSVVIIAALLLPETYGRDLRSLDLVAEPDETEVLRNQVQTRLL
jgi:MFS family permease